MSRTRNSQGDTGAGISRDSSQRGVTPAFLDSLSIQTQTIDLNTLFGGDVTETGSFDIRGVRKTTFAKLLDAIPIAVVLLDSAHCIAFSNEAFPKNREDRSEVPRAPFWTVLVRSTDQDRCRECLAAITIERKPQVMEAVLSLGEKRIWGRLHMRAVRMGAERFILVLVEDLTAEKKQSALSRKYAASLKIAHDELERRVVERTAELLKANEELKHEISSRKQVQKSLSLAARVISTCNEAILITDSRAAIVHVNEAFCQITGYAREEVLGQNPRIMSSGRHAKAFWNEFWQTLRTSGHWRGEVWDRRKNGDVFPKLLAVSAIRAESGTLTHYVAIFSDITKMKQTEERLENLAHYDPLTQLPNRLLFRDRTIQALLHAERDGTSLAVMFVDLDGFKNVNDTLGHVRGDELLVAVADRLRQCVRRSDTVARLGGDEFTVLMPDLSEVRHVILAARRIIDAMQQPLLLSGEQIFTSASIGISLFPTNGKDYDSLLKHADTAMYCAKSQGKNGFQFFSEQMNEELTRLAKMEIVLRHAMERDGLLLHYQPVFDVQTGHVISMEALLRLKDSTGKVVSAGPFVPVAEERGLIVPLGEWVLRTACQQNGLWRQAGHQPLQLAVNVSMKQLREPNLFQRFFSVLDDLGYDPGYLELELTESALTENSTVVTEMLHEFRKYGVSITIDDFGTGYSSLNRLRSLPVDKLKIDRSFLRDVPQDSAQKALVQAIVTVAHSLNMKVVAEGVEREEQLSALCDLGCDAVQGHYFSPAVSPEDFEKRILTGMPVAVGGNPLVGAICPHVRPTGRD
jgi:diguanylate cyclase (GGDEF)-like protein/PAS domain S-box-containing protein